MPRTCTVCAHPQRGGIDRALVNSEPLRSIAQQYGTSATALHRHKEDHLPKSLTKAQEAKEVAQADDILAQLKALRNKAMGLLLKAEAAGDYRTALAGVREARACLELLAELEGELDRRPQINILMAPEWFTVRAAIFNTLVPYPEARTALAGRLAELEAGK